MSAHRRHYLQLPPPAQPTRQRGAEQGVTVVVHTLVVCMSLIALVSGVLAYTNRSEADATPVRTPLVEVFPLGTLADAHALADARIEGFRAGQASAHESGCAQPALTWPVPTQ